MFRFVSAAACALLAFTQTADAGVVNFPVGTYYRPFPWEVSGRVGATTTYTRSPCPALNSMANHGYIPRDGKGLTRALLKAAVMERFNIDNGLADVMAGLAPNTTTFTLATLSEHNAIEHDVSLSRKDVYLGGDQSFADPLFLLELSVRAATSGKLTLKETAVIRNNRLVECNNRPASATPCDYGPNQKFIANAESGLMLRALGGQNSEEISLRNIVSFFVGETFPEGFTKSPTPVTLDQVLATSAALDAVPV